jgi:hypothetical protein
MARLQQQCQRRHAGILPGNIVLECVIPKFPLAEGHYFLNVSLNENRQRSDMIQDALRFTVLPGAFYKTEGLRFFERGVDGIYVGISVICIHIKHIEAKISLYLH